MFNLFFKNKFIYIFGFATFNLFSINPLSSDYITINKSFNSSSGFIEKDFLLNSKSFLEEINLENEFKNYDNNFLNLLANNKENNEIEIISDIQYEKDNIFYAEGNASLFLSNAELKGDKFLYNRLTREFVAEGNISFEKGNQYFEASKIVYNFREGKGYINEVYGVLNVDNFSEISILIQKKI